MKVAVIGCGVIAQEHLRSIQRVPGAEVVGVADPSPAALEATAETWAIASTYQDPETLIAEKRPDVVHITTPPGDHERLVRLALEAGCHVYVEKPITLRAPEAEQLLELAEKKGLMVCVGYMHNFDRVVLEARRIFDAGEIGSLCGIESYYGFDLGGNPASRYFGQAYTHWAYGLPGGLFQNGFDHPLSVVMPFMGEPKTVLATAADVGVLPQGVPGELRLLLNDGRCLASVTLSEAASPRFHYLNLLGSEGTLQLDLQNKRLFQFGHKPGIPHFVTRFGMNLTQASQILTGTAGTVVDVARGRFTPFEGMRKLITLFYEAIEKGSPNPMPPEYALRIMRIMDSTWEQVAEELKPAERIRSERRLPRLRPEKPGARKVLVTGGTGFIGSRLVRDLLARGNDVRILARNLRKAEPLRQAGAEVVVGNLFEADSVEQAVEGVDVVYHLGATMGGKWVDFELGTIKATELLVRAAKRAGVRRIVYASTIAVYGVPKLGRGQKLDEDAPLADRHLNHYMRSKIEAEKVLKGQPAGVEFSILRLGVVYGPEKGHKISRVGYPVGSRFFVKVGLFDRTLPSVFVANAVEALRLAGESPKAAGRTYNVVDDACFTQIGFLRAIGRHTGRKARNVRFPYTIANLMGSVARAFEAKNGIARRVSGLMSPFHLRSCAYEMRYDNSRLKQELGWAAGTDLESQLRATFSPAPQPAAPVTPETEPVAEVRRSA